MLKTSKWHQTGRSKKMCSASSVSLCHSYNSCSEASPVLPVVQFPRHPQSSPNLSSGWDLRVEQQWKHNEFRCHLGRKTVISERKNTENLWKHMIQCMIIYQHLHQTMTLKESKNINSHEHRIFTLIPFFPFPWCVFFSNPTQETETLRIPISLRKSSWCCDFFWADWAIKCAVCKELLQLNLGRFSGASYYVVI